MMGEELNLPQTNDDKILTKIRNQGNLYRTFRKIFRKSNNTSQMKCPLTFLKNVIEIDAFRWNVLVQMKSLGYLYICGKPIARAWNNTLHPLLSKTEDWASTDACWFAFLKPRKYSSVALRQDFRVPATSIKELLTSKNTSVATQPSYSPDLSTCDCLKQEWKHTSKDSILEYCRILKQP